MCMYAYLYVCVCVCDNSNFCSRISLYVLFTNWLNSDLIRLLQCKNYFSFVFCNEYVLAFWWNIQPKVTAYHRLISAINNNTVHIIKSLVMFAVDVNYNIHPFIWSGLRSCVNWSPDVKYKGLLCNFHSLYCWKQWFVS